MGILHEGELVAEGTLEELRAEAPVTTELELVVDGDVERARRAASGVSGVVDASVSMDGDASSAEVSSAEAEASPLAPTRCRPGRKSSPPPRVEPRLRPSPIRWSSASSQPRATTT